MKIFTKDNTDESSVEVLFSCQELKVLVEALIKFESRIEQFKNDNKGKNLGFTHMHFKDCGQVGQNSKSDIIFYVDLDGE